MKKIKYFAKILKRWFNKDESYPTDLSTQLVETIDTYDYRVDRNEWGWWKLKNRDLDTIIKISKDTIVFRGTYFNRGVLAYPRFVSKNLTTRVEDYMIKNLVSDIEYTFESKGIKHNVAYDFWIYNNFMFDISLVEHEIMIWEEHLIAKPSGKKILTDKFINGNLYDVYTGKIDKSKENLGTDGWVLTTFVKKTNNTNYDYFSISRFLRVMKEQEIITDNDLQKTVSEIEFGTEVFNDAGKLTLTKYGYEWI